MGCAWGSVYIHSSLRLGCSLLRLINAKITHTHTSGDDTGSDTGRLRRVDIAPSQMIEFKPILFCSTIYYAVYVHSLRWSLSLYEILKTMLNISYLEVSVTTLGWVESQLEFTIIKKNRGPYFELALITKQLIEGNCNYVSCNWRRSPANFLEHDHVAPSAMNTSGEGFDCVLSCTETKKGAYVYSTHTTNGPLQPSPLDQVVGG